MSAVSQLHIAIVHHDLHGLTRGGIGTLYQALANALTERAPRITLTTRLARYRDFDEMFDHEPVSSINPTASRVDQLRNIREIYPPERKSWEWSRSALSWSPRDL